MTYSIKKKEVRADEMAQWIKGLAAKLDNLSLFLRIHIAEGKN